jgi:Uma2 family endonuclease
MATEPKTTGLTYEDLLRMFPEEDNKRRELIHGTLVVTPSPDNRHQQAVMTLSGYLYNYSRELGGQAFGSPLDVYITEHNVLEPDVIFITAPNVGKLRKRNLRFAPDLVVEVSSPSTRKYDVGRKRELYAEMGIPEYWFVDLDANRIEVNILSGSSYRTPTLLERDTMMTSERLPGLSIPVDEIQGEELPD